MTEAVEAEFLSKSPLDPVHRRSGATMIEREGWSVPETYGDVLFEYASVRERGAGLIDLSWRGRILVSGSEAVQFLNGLITNDMKTLAENSGMPAAFPNVQGRLIASVRVIRLSDEQAATDKKTFPLFLIDTEALTHDRVLKTIERFTLAGDFRVTDVTNQTAHIAVRGRNAATVVSDVVGLTASEFAPNAAAQMAYPKSDPSGNLTIFCAAHAAEDGFELIVDADQANNLWEALCAAGARPVGYDALEMLRIEAGIPRFGLDMDETNIVTEAGLDDAVSYTKGCYVGQEIIARIKYRGHVAKRLSGIKFGNAVKVEAGAAIKSVDDKEIGRITSSTYSPHLGRTLALGYLKYDYLTSETGVKIIAGDNEIPAQVAELPFVRRTEI